ncbi:MAG TPA: transcriptional regulator [Actinomycetota bacterium]
MSHPAVDLDDLVHQRVRLAILAVLVEASRVDFRYLKDTLGLTDGNLSRHLQVLEEARLVTLSKGFEGKRPRTWITVTRAGRGAFTAEIDALKAIVGRFDRTRRQS